MHKGTGAQGVYLHVGGVLLVDVLARQQAGFVLYLRLEDRG